MNATSNASRSGFSFGIPSGFLYFRPERMAEACQAVAENPNALLMAGGTDLLVEMRNREFEPGIIVDLKGIEKLRKIRRTREDRPRIEIGALCTVNDVLADTKLCRMFPAVFQAATVFACHEIRNRATVGGNIAHSSPGAEFSPPFLVHDAEVIIEGTDGERTIKMKEFFLGPNRNVLDRKKGEILTAIRLLIPEKETVSAYSRLSRVAGMDLACASLALRIENPGIVEQRVATLALGSMAPTPLLRPEVSLFLSRREWTPDIVDEAKKIMLEGIEPRKESIRSTPEYKKHLLSVRLEEMLRDFDSLREVKQDAPKA